MRRFTQSGRIVRSFCYILLSVTLFGPAVAPNVTAQSLERVRSSVGETGLPLPRFVSLSVAKANMRTGPGRRYPILWVYVRQNHPIEITAEFGLWRRVRDQDGTTGWMHSRLLSGRRTALITGDIRVLRTDPRPDAGAVMRVEPGVIAEIVRCDAVWCRLEVGGRRGWLLREQMWGTYLAEEID